MADASKNEIRSILIAVGDNLPAGRQAPTAAVACLQTGTNSGDRRSF